MQHNFLRANNIFFFLALDMLPASCLFCHIKTQKWTFVKDGFQKFLRIYDLTLSKLTLGDFIIKLSRLYFSHLSTGDMLGKSGGMVYRSVSPLQCTLRKKLVGLIHWASEVNTLIDSYRGYNVQSVSLLKSTDLFYTCVIEWYSITLDIFWFRKYIKTP